MNDHLGQCFKLWDACNKIYTECFVSHKRVSYILYILDCLATENKMQTKQYKMQTGDKYVILMSLEQHNIVYMHNICSVLNNFNREQISCSI